MARRFYPRGKLNEGDEGALRISIGNDYTKGVVVVDFQNVAVRWFALEPDLARGLAANLLKHAELADSSTHGRGKPETRAAAEKVFGMLPDPGPDKTNMMIGMNPDGSATRITFSKAATHIDLKPVELGALIAALKLRLDEMTGESDVRTESRGPVEDGPDDHQKPNGLGSTEGG